MRVPDNVDPSQLMTTVEFDTGPLAGKLIYVVP